MLSDIITFVLGMALILFGTQAMLNSEIRKRPTEVIRSLILVVGGIFLVYYWNVMTKKNY